MHGIDDEAAFCKAVEHSIRDHGINSVAIYRYTEFINNLRFCPNECLAELLNIIADFKDYSEEELHAKHNGHSWLDFEYAVCGEFTERIIHGNDTAKECNIDQYSEMTYFLEDDAIRMNGKEQTNMKNTVSRTLLDLMTCGEATKITIEFADGTFYREEFSDGERTYTEWTEREGTQTI